MPWEATRCCSAGRSRSSSETRSASSEAVCLLAAWDSRESRAVICFSIEAVWEPCSRATRATLLSRSPIRRSETGDVAGDEAVDGVGDGDSTAMPAAAKATKAAAIDSRVAPETTNR